MPKIVKFSEILSEVISPGVSSKKLLGEQSLVDKRMTLEVIKMDSDSKKRIEDLITSNSIMVFMKGSKMMPQCGFSNNVVQILNSLGINFDTFDVLEDMDIRQAIKEYSNWPTIPQVYVKGEFMGGSDILIQLYNSGELGEKLEIALAS